MGPISLIDALRDKAGLIVPCKSGVSWTNQVGGIMIFHPEVEGVFVPLPFGVDDISAVQDLAGDFGSIKGAVRQFLADNHMGSFFSAPDSFDGRCGEAWLPLVVREQHPAMPHRSVLKQLEGVDCILTWENSD